MIPYINIGSSLIPSFKLTVDLHKYPIDQNEIYLLLWFLIEVYITYYEKPSESGSFSSEEVSRMAHRSQSAVREIDGDEDGRGVGEPVDDVRGRQVV